MNAWLRLMRFDRPIGTLLLLWPTAWALLVAGNGHPSWRNVLIFLTGVVVMRAAGCVINDYADRDFDPHVARTRSRPLATGEVQPQHALILFVGLLVLAFLLVLQTNWLTIRLAFIGAILAAVYPFLKRVTNLPQVVLGIAFGWSIPMVFAAETGHVPIQAWWWLAINIAWTVAYDTEYALADREDDRRIGVKSTALLFGRYDRLIIAALQFSMLVLLALYSLAYLVWPNSWPVWLALLLIALEFARQQWLLKDREPDRCLQAFLANNRVGLIIFLGLLGYYQLA